MTTTAVPRIGGGRRAMETVLCNNNWMAVSFHLSMTPFAFCDCGRTKKRKKDPAQGTSARDGQSACSYDDGNDSRVTTSGCGCEILQRARPARLFLSLDQEWTMEIFYTSRVTSAGKQRNIFSELLVFSLNYEY